MFIIHSMDKHGGTERVTANLSNAFSRTKGYKVTIATLYGKTSSFGLHPEVRLESFENPVNRNLYQRLLALRRYIITNKPDVIVGVSVNRLNILIALLTFFLNYRPKLIASEHIALSNSKWFLKQIKSVLYKRFSNVSVLTEHDHKEFSRLGLDNVIQIPNASSYYPEQQLEITQRRKRILAVGRLTYQKAFDRLIDIWSQIHRKYPDWILTIIGEGEEQESILQQAKNEGLDSTRIEMLPFCTDVDRYFLDSQIFAMTSRFEGLPMVLIEALCLGCPIISYDCETGPREIVVDGVNGYLVEDGRTEGFIQKLESLLSNESDRRRFSLNAFAMREKYHIENIVSQWKELML